MPVSTGVSRNEAFDPPLSREWEETHETMEQLVAEAAEADAEARRTKAATKAGALTRRANAALAEGRRLRDAFVERVAAFRVPDPECGRSSFFIWRCSGHRAPGEP